MVPLNIDLPEGFLDEEVRCGYTVTRKMKEVWAVELDLLNELLKVCKKYNLKIWGDGGTLLGAVRHKGFIPWDDDIDVMMMRDDYIKLCDVADREFSEPYFFQTEYTDPGCLRPHAQLRNSMTTGILKSEKECRYDFNQGIFLDIFPLDNVCENPEMYNKQAKKACLWRGIAMKLSRFSYRYLEGKSVFKKVIKKLIYLFANHVIRLFRLEQRAFSKFEKVCMLYNGTETQTVSQLSMSFEKKNLYRDIEDYRELICVPFEFMELPIPKGYEHELDRRYGNWRVPEMISSTHGGLIIDTNKSYVEYFKNMERS